MRNQSIHTASGLTNKAVLTGVSAFAFLLVAPAGLAAAPSDASSGPIQTAQADLPKASGQKSTAIPIETVTVTARRRSEKAQDVPIALSVLGGAQLESGGVDNLRTLYLQVPSLNVEAHNPRNTAMTIRGIGATIANDALVNSVANDCCPIAETVSLVSSEVYLPIVLLFAALVS